MLLLLRPAFLALVLLPCVLRRGARARSTQQQIQSRRRGTRLQRAPLFLFLLCRSASRRLRAMSEARARAEQSHGVGFFFHAFCFLFLRACCLALRSRASWARHMRPAAARSGQEVKRARQRLASGGRCFHQLPCFFFLLFSTEEEEAGFFRCRRSPSPPLVFLLRSLRSLSLVRPLSARSKGYLPFPREREVLEQRERHRERERVEGFGKPISKRRGRSKKKTIEPDRAQSLTSTLLVPPQPPPPSLGGKKNHSGRSLRQVAQRARDRARASSRSPQQQHFQLLFLAR